MTTDVLPSDVRRLVIAARVVAFEGQSPTALKELDAASEAFADRVPWDDEPDAASTGELCSDCPPVNYPTDKTRCAPCPRRS